MWRRVSNLFVGILLMAGGTALCNYTGLGIDPFNAFCIGNSALLGVSLGTFTLLAQSVLAVAALFMNRSYLGIGSLIPMVFFGYFLEFFNWFIPGVFSSVHGFYAGALWFIPGMLLIAIGMSVYMGCNLGMVPYDSISFLLGERTGRSAFALRVLIDAVFALLAFMVRGPISVGTVLLAFGIGPLLGAAKGWRKWRDRLAGNG